MKEESDFRIVEPKMDGDVIVNKTDPKSGALLCPECGRGAVWGSKETGYLTSPMSRLKIAGKINALAHCCCQRALIHRVFAKPAPEQTAALNVHSAPATPTDEQK